jgi:hypothetical protein
MDDVVVRSMAKWPQVPDVYGWLSLDRRGNWLIKGERIGNLALREFIGRNYQPDARGCWYFQNGPQRVFVQLAYTPLVIHFEDQTLLDHCGRLFEPAQVYLDEEGSLLMAGKPGIGLLDDRDLERFADQAERLPRLASSTVAARFGYVGNPVP